MYNSDAFEYFEKEFKNLINMSYYIPNTPIKETYDLLFSFY